MGDYDWLSLIIVINLFVVGGGALVAGATSTGTFNFLLGLVTFGIAGVSGVMITIVSGIITILNLMGAYIIAKMIRGN